MKPEVKQKLEEIKSLREKYLQSLSDSFESVLLSMTKELFELDHKVKGISWTQYTPHFNDGDPCTFSVNEVELCLSWEDAKENERVLYGACEVEVENDELAVANTSSYALKSYGTEEQKPRFEPLLELLDEIQGVLVMYESLLETTYGDGVRVIVTPTGVHTNEYRHD